MMRLRLTVAAWLLIPVLTGEAQRVPSGWTWHLDQPARLVLGQDAPAGSWQFQEMRPGMHVTSGPGVTVFLENQPSPPRFMVDADLLLFGNSTDNGYGIMFGGKPGADTVARLASWNAFLVSGNGRFAVLRHEAGQTTAIVSWTPNDAVVKRGTDVVTNKLRVWVEPDSIRFIVNGTRLASVPRQSMDADGLFGLRLNEGINLHVTNVDLVRRLLNR